MSENHTSEVIAEERRPNTDLIFVNQDKHKVATQRVSYDEIVAFYLSDGGAPSNEYLVVNAYNSSCGVLYPVKSAILTNASHSGRLLSLRSL